MLKTMTQFKVLLLFTTLIGCSIAAERVSVRKCLEYAQWNGENADGASLNLTDFVTTKFAGPKEFPHMALLGYQENDGDNITYVCAGSLISENFVLTAANCLSDRYLGEPKYVRLGDLDISKDDDDAQPLLLKVIESIQHDSFKHPNKYNDIGLLKLEKNVKFNQYIRPACLAQSFDDAADGKAFATGWGTTNFFGEPSELLKKSVMEITPHERCQTEYGAESSRRLKYGIIDAEQICATAVKENEGTCQGDTGGPLQVYHPTARSMYIIMGITSFGKTCASVVSADVFTRVYGYLDWIEARVWPNV